MVRIAVDAMGGDQAPRVVVAGAVEAARTFGEGVYILLLGDEAQIQAELASQGGKPANLEVRHASETVAMHESPALAVRKKKDSSISRAVDLVKSGEAKAVFSAGNTGAAVAAATLKLRTLQGIDRPAIATVIPSPERPFILLDAGANTDCPPDLLVQFAVMGRVYAREILGRDDPRVGLLSIGEEDSKGNDITRTTHRMLGKAPLSFAGNVEPSELFAGRADVVVCDGFVGNVVLKTCESVARTMAHWMKEAFTSNPIRMSGAFLLQGAIRDLRRRTTPEVYGGAPLLGANGVVIIGHGSSTATAVANGIRVARESVAHHITEAIVRDMAEVRTALDLASPGLLGASL